MIKNNAILFAGAVLVAFAGGVLLGKNIDRGEAEMRDSAGHSLIAPTARNRAGDRLRRPFQELRGENAPRPRDEAAKEFGFDRLILETNGDTPRACLQFTRELDVSGAVNYADFVRLTPGDKPAVEVAGSSLCLSGLEFDKEYTAKVRAGAPSKGGEHLERPVEVTIAFGDKPSYVGFAGDGVILPRLEADGIGIETVNVDRIAISVFRVSDRSLARKEIVKGEAIPEDDYFYVYGREDGEDVGVKVFDQELTVKRAENETVTTVFSLGAALPDLSPGAYFIKIKDVSAGADEYRVAQSWRWVMFTDLALTTYSSSEGIDAFVRSISTGRPLTGVELELVATNNDILGRVVTNAEGRARFEKALVNGDYPLTPRMIMAYGAQEDFAALDLERAPLDLSDRNIDGRAAPSVLDGYIYLDRGIYRPGETAHISTLLRDASGNADERPVTMTIYRPNGTQAHTERFETFFAGGFSFSFDVPKSAPRGVWRAEVKADGAGVVGNANFSVEDFVPQRLEVKIAADEEKPMRWGDAREIDINARYLYGAPAGALEVESEARLRIDPNPFPAFNGYRFGPTDARFEERFLNLAPATTDADGKARVELKLDGASGGVGIPMRADLVVGVVEPGGRVVRESARIPVRADKGYLGLKLGTESYGFSQNEPAAIDAVLLDWNGKQLAGEVEWRLVEEDYWFDWYRQNGEWRWRRSYKDVLVAEGRATATAAAPVRITQPLDAGSYRLTAVDPTTGVRSDIRFYVGWRSYESGADTPDQATLSVVSENVTPGARARLFLDPPYAGEAIITVATDKVHLVQRMKVEDAGREIIIDTDPSWGAGFYVLTSIVTPRDAVNQPIPRRAMGVSYVAFDMAAKKLALNINTPDVLRPRQTFNAPVKIEGIARGEDVMLTVAAVDEGILRLTKFASPDPVEYYYGKKRLGVDVRDDYGRILDANLGAAARFGGDQLGGEGLTVVPVKSVALFNGPVQVDDNGEATIALDVPDFNGELRIMAVAWSKDKLGSLAQPLTVRDAVPAVLSLPRFLGPNDQAQATLLIDNVDGEAGDYAVSVTANEPVSAETTQSFALTKAEQATALFPITAGSVGVGDVGLSVTGPRNFAVSRSYPIEVRTPYFPVTEVAISQMEAGGAVSLGRDLIANYVSGSTAVSVSFSRLRGVDPAPLLDSLYRYPYGCSEQLTSSALPLLYLNDLGAEAGRKPEYEVRPRVQDAINQILNRQGADGAFGLWREGDTSGSPWLGAYVTDFLYRAKEDGYGVPQEALDRAYDAMAKIAKTDSWVYIGYHMQAYEGPWSNDTTDQLRKRAAAYALYVLARAGRADLSDLRYFHDALLDNVKSPLAKAHIGAALAMFGDRARSLSALKKAVGALGYENTGDYYQTPLRDAAGVLALLAETQNAALVNSASNRFVELMKEPNRMHTQEKAFVLLATQAMLRTSGPIALKRNGDAVDLQSPAPRFNLTTDDIVAGVEFTNAGEGAIFSSVSVYGSPSTPPSAAASGFDLSKRVFTRTGGAADLAAVKQNDRLVIVLSGSASADRLHPSVIADLLPAGFEIEAVLRPEDGAPHNPSSGAAGPYGWVGKISYPKIAEARDDRFVAAIDLSGRNKFTIAYIVRAVTPGDFVFPGAVIEDMYRPGVFARTATSALKITAAQE